MGNDVALGAMPALKPLFDAVDSNNGAVIIDESKRIRAELGKIRASAAWKTGPAPDH